MFLTGSVIGVVIATLTLAALSVGLTGTPIPQVPPLAGAALLVGVAALAMTAILIPTRLALRANPAEAIAVREEAATTSTIPPIEIECTTDGSDLR